jgi:flagellar basal-body rod protein FlgG
VSGAFYIGAIGLDAQQKALDTIANNISNINTSGFKRTEVRFTDILSRRKGRQFDTVPSQLAVEAGAELFGEAGDDPLELGLLR